MRILITAVNTDVISDEVNYCPLIICENLQDAIDYIRNNCYSKYLHVEKFALFTLRDSDKLIARFIDNKILID